MVFLLAILVFGLALAGMSLGVILSDRRIHGSCGGLSNLRGKHGKVACDACPSGGRNCDDHEQAHSCERD